MYKKISLLILLTTSVAMAQLKHSYPDNVNVADSLQLQPKTDINTGRFVLASSGIIAANWAVYQPFKKVWWDEKRTGFHFYRGYRRTEGFWDFGWHDSYYGHLDKLGHLYSSKILSEVLIDVATWVGYSRKTSKFIGTTLSFLLMSEIEIYDSFFEEWGFSLADFTANAVGSYSPFIADKFPFMKHFKLKMSYHESKYLNIEESFIKDYAGMTFWLSCHIDHILPEKVSNFWPDYLNIAVGYGFDKPHGNVEIYLAPDIDLTRLIKTDNKFLNRMIHFLDYIHVPLFAWKITPHSKFYYAYF